MKGTAFFLLILSFLFVLTGCSGSQAVSVLSSQSTPTHDAVIPTAVEGVMTTEELEAAGIGAATAADAMAENSQTHEDAADTLWDESEVIPVQLNDTSISAGGEGVVVDGSVATINTAGIYRLSGPLSDGQIIVDTQDSGVVGLILDGVDLNCASSAPIFIRKAEKVVILLAEGSINTLSDGVKYVFAKTGEDEPNAAIFSKANLSIAGGGLLRVYGNYNDAIVSKDGLILAGGTLEVQAVDDGLRGKDYLVVKDTNITVKAGGDGLKSDDKDSGKGYIAIESGTVMVTSGKNAIDAASDILITGGELSLVSGGGSSADADRSILSKGLKARVNIIIDGGTVVIDATADAIHSNGSLVINGGVLNLSSEDDGLHSDKALTVNDGLISITKSYEGLESAMIAINGGDLNIVSGNDGINVADEKDGSDDYHLYIHGGSIVVDAGGDGLDVNGSIEMTGGVVIVNGPVDSKNGALDFDSFTVGGGIMAAAGSSGMAQAPGGASSQNSLLLIFTTQQQAGTLVEIQDSHGRAILTFAPTKKFQTLAFSSPDLVNGSVYRVFTGGNAAGMAIGGFYQDGAQTPGDLYTTFTISGALTQVGGSAGFQP